MLALLLAAASVLSTPRVADRAVAQECKETAGMVKCRGAADTKKGSFQVFLTYTKAGGAAANVVAKIGAKTIACTDASPGAVALVQTALARTGSTLEARFQNGAASCIHSLALTVE